MAQNSFSNSKDEFINSFNKSYDEYVQKNPEPVKYDNPAPTTGTTTAPTTPAQAEANRVVDAHFSPQWVIDEQQKRRNPDYVSEISNDVINPEMFDALATYVSGKRDTNPDLWQYGDPGWDKNDVVWTDIFEPLEREYQEIQQAKMVQAQQGTTYNDVIDKVNSDKRFSGLQVDNTGANWNTMQGEEKLIAGITPGMAGTDIENTPEIVKYTQPIVGSYMSSSGIGRLAKYGAIAAGLPGVGWIAAGAHAAGFVYNYEKSLGNIEGNKAVDKVMELMDILDTKSQQFQGALAYGFEKAGGGDLSNGAEFFTNMKFLFDNFGDVMHYAFGSGKASTEYASAVVGAVTSQTANMGATTFIGNLESRLVRSGLSLIGGDGYYVNRNETTRNNQGISGVQTIDESMLGSNAIPLMLDYAQALYDAGITDENLLEFYVGQKVAEVWGDLANFSEYLEHELTDPGNVAENAEPAAIGKYAQLTGDKNLEIAAGKANTGTLAGALTSTLPSPITDSIRAIGKYLGNPDILKTGGGIDEVLAQWNIENINSPASQLTARDKRFSGINDEGIIDNGTLGRTSSFTPNRNTATSKVGKILENAINFISETNESKAYSQADATFDYVMLGLEDALRPRTDNETDDAKLDRINMFLDSIEHPEILQEGDALYTSSQSALFNTIKGDLAEAVRTKRPEIEKVMLRYSQQDSARNALNTLATSLGLTPQKVLDMYQNQKTVLTQMIVDKADQNGGMLPGIKIPDVLNSADFGTRVLDMIKPFVGQEPEAFDSRQLILQVSSDVADSLGDVLITKYNIEPEKFIYRFGDTIKSMQNLLLLGLSPSYLANNFINNTVTRAALGYGGYMSSEAINGWMERYGYAPDRMAESLSGEIGQAAMNSESNYDKFKMKVADKKRIKDGLYKVNQKASDASKKFGLFGNLSNKIESAESRQVLAMAMMHYMNKTWKEGVNFRKMPTQLEAAIERQNPGMSKAIYAAISKGINMDEIRKSIFGAFVAPSVEETLRASTQRLGISEDIISEYFAKNGMLAELERALDGKQGKEIADVIKDFSDRLKALLKIEFDEEIARRAETISNEITEEGFATALECAYDTADEFEDIWMYSVDVNSRIFQRRIEEGIPTKDFRAMYQNHQKNLTERWKQVYEKSQQTFAGILRGIGITNEHNKDYVMALKEKNDLWIKFYETDQPAIIQPYLKALEWHEGDTRATWDSRVKEAWKTYQTNIKAKVNEVHTAEAEIQKRMDQAYMDGLKEALGEEHAKDVDSIIAPIFEKINAKREEITKQNEIVRKDANKTNELNRKNKAWLDADQKRKELISQYTNLQYDLYDAIEGFKPFIVNKVGADPNIDVDHKANIIADVAEDRANNRQRKAAVDSERATDAIAEGKNVPEAVAYVKYSKEILKRLPKWARNILTDTSKSILERHRDVKEELLFAYRDKLTDAQDRLLQSISVDLQPYQLDWLIGLTEDITHGINNTDEKLTLSDDKYVSYVEAMHANGMDDNFREFFEWALLEDGIPENVLTSYEMEVESLTDVYQENLINLEEYTNMRNSYIMNRKTLEDIALRTGASPETAEAFSRYVNLVADRWEKNHPGEDFFHNAPGIGGLSVIFHKFSDESAAGNYDYRGGLINLFAGGQDIFTLLHELGHGFQWTLDINQQNELAQYFGISLEEYTRLQELYANNQWRMMTEEEKAKYFDITETFARGFADYLATNEAPTTKLKNIFDSFKHFLEQVFGDISTFVFSELNYDKNWYHNYINVSRDTVGIYSTGGIVRATDVKNNITLQQIFDQFIDVPENERTRRISNSDFDDVSFDGIEFIDNENEKTNNDSFSQTYIASDDPDDGERGAMQTLNGWYSPMEWYEGDLGDLFGNTFDSIHSFGTLGNAIANFSKELFEYLRDAVYPKDETNEGNLFAPPTVSELMQYILQDTDEDGAKYISAERTKAIDFLIDTLNESEYAKEIIKSLRANRSVYVEADAPAKGRYIARCYSFDFPKAGKYNIVAIVYEDGKPVAYVPSAMDTWSIQDGDSTYQVLGLSPDNPDQWVYIADGEIRTERVRQEQDNNVHKGDMPKDSMPTTDPTGDAHNQFAYENVFKILDDFVDLYQREMNDSMTNKQMSSLDEKTRAEVQRYIDSDVRSDLLNTKYKTGKFGEMVRDSALLNYSKRYGFDNALTLLCPYQFWMTRSFAKWLSRASSKGSNMWKRYYKLKKLEERNKKEFMPSKITGKFGLYIPGLPDWMGDQIFMSTDQLIPASQFIDPALRFMKNKNNRNNAVTATAEKYLQEALEAHDISYQDYLACMNPETRNDNPIWQEMYAKAELVEDSDSSIGGLMGDYLGLNLPLSVAQALYTGDQSGWNQWPMTRTGTAFRAIVGDNWVGKLGENVLSAPEKALRKAAVSTFGNAFEYNEFGAFGDYYLRNQVFDMVAEGRISAEDAVKACIEKDGNKIWEEAADRQREETLVKMQGGSVIDAMKKLASDKDADAKTIQGDWMYLLASIITAPMSKTIVHEAERGWRQDKAELQEAYAAKDAGDKDAVNRYYDEHPNATYNNLRYEKDPEILLRQYLYKNIMDNWYNLDTAEQNQLRMSFGADFDRDVINKETRAIEAMDLNRLAAYAQALNGSIPYLATDKINTTNIPEIPIMPVQQTVLDEYNAYREERDRLYPGMSKVNSLYYDLPAEDRKAFKQAVPNLDAYQKWDKQYKTNHPNVKQFSGLISDYYDLQEAEDACALFDTQTMKELKNAAYSNSMPDKIYKPIIERIMAQVGTTDSYDNFVKGLKKYILGQ